jgi:hypothetical protein
MTKRLNKIGLWMLAVGALLLTLVVGGLSAQAAQDDISGAKATINIIDTKGNVLKTSDVTYEPNGLDVNVTFPGYDPATTLEEVDFEFNPKLSPNSKASNFKVNQKTGELDMTQTFYVDKDKEGSANKTTLDSLTNPASSSSTINQAFARYIDFYNIGIAFYSTDGKPFNTVKSLGVPSKFTVIYDYQEATMPVEYVNDNNGQVVKKDTITGFLGKKGDYTPVAPAGYQLVSSKAVSYDLSSKTNAKMVIHVVPIRVTPVNPTPVTPTPVTPPSNDNWNPTTPKQADGKTGLPNYAEAKKSAIYAIKPIYMYSSPNFTKSDRVAKYPMKTRLKRPMFVINGYARSNNGALRYKVRDVNHGSKTAGKVGYITANRKYVESVYYKSVPKSKKITVISKKGVNAYRHANLTGKTAHYKKGTHLRVTKLVKHNLTTRYQLPNGRYVTANKLLVIQGTY